jgi:hypothetical protein
MLSENHNTSAKRSVYIYYKYASYNRRHYHLWDSQHSMMPLRQSKTLSCRFDWYERTQPTRNTFSLPSFLKMTIRSPLLRRSAGNGRHRQAEDHWTIFGTLPWQAQLSESRTAFRPARVDVNGPHSGWQASRLQLRPLQRQAQNKRAHWHPGPGVTTGIRLCP